MERVVPPGVDIYFTQLGAKRAPLPAASVLSSRKQSRNTKLNTPKNMHLPKKLSALVAAAILAAPVAMFAESSTDSLIESAAKKNMPSNIADKVTITSQDSIVTLTGNLPNDSQRRIAVSAVKQVPQVKDVTDDIKVAIDMDSSTASTTTVSADTTTTKHHSDKWIALKVKSELFVHKNVSATHTDVNVVNGVVTLSGFASSDAQKELTAQYTKNVEGVQDVKNEIEVRDATAPVATTTTTANGTFAGDSNYSTGNKIDDSAITTKVKLQLAKHKSTSAMKTEVHTQNGVVMISGTAANAAEKDLVTQLAQGVPGVSSVTNNMDIPNQ
jgi:hyperosmotically inducible protein